MLNHNATVIWTVTSELWHLATYWTVDIGAGGPVITSLTAGAGSGAGAPVTCSGNVTPPLPTPGLPPAPRPRPRDLTTSLPRPRDQGQASDVLIEYRRPPASRPCPASRGSLWFAARRAGRGSGHHGGHCSPGGRVVWFTVSGQGERSPAGSYDLLGALPPPGHLDGGLRSV